MERDHKTLHRALTDIWTTSCQYPLSVSDGQDTTYICWQQYAKGHDTIMAGKLGSDGLKTPLIISGEGEALKPAAVFHDGAFYFVWSECVDKRWRILLRTIEGSVLGPIRSIDEGVALFYPTLSIVDDAVAVLWCDQGKRSSKVMLWTSASADTPPQVVSTSPEVYRPSMAVGGDGYTYLVYDRFNGSNYDVVARVRADGAWMPEQVVAVDENRWAASPIVVPASMGVVLGWYDYGAGAAFAFKSAWLSLAGSAVMVSKPCVLTSAVDWYQDISLSSNGTDVVFAYTWGKTNVHVRRAIGNEGWSAPVVMSFDDTNCAVHPHVRLDAHGMVNLSWQFALKNGHQQHRNAQVVYSTLALKDFTKNARPDAEQKRNDFTLPIPTPKRLDVPQAEATRQWLARNGFADLQPVFGDIHGQSGISDGMGELDQYFQYARLVAGLDFTALTDHDCYPDWMSESEWEWIRTTSSLFNCDGDLTTLLSYEWTPNEYRYDFGHKNVYYPGDEGGLYRSGDEGGMTPDRLFTSVKQFGAMAFAHHPAATWTMVSAATDWAFHDEDVQRVVEIYSRHAPFEFFGNTSIFTKNNPQLRHCSVQDALKLGYHMGFIAGSDSHQMEHGVEGGIIGLLVNTLNRGEVFDALYARSTWATTGARIMVSLKLNGQSMGSVVHVDVGTQVALEASVLGTDACKVELLCNNEVIFTQRSIGQVCDFNFSDRVLDEKTWYYLRVTQDDNHQAWSSPVWVE